MSGVDRAALIEATAEALLYASGEHPRSVARFEAEIALRAALPLVAQAIEADGLKWKHLGGYSEYIGACSAANAVRSLAEEGQQQ